MPVVEQTALGTVTPSIVSSGSCRCRGGLKSFCLTDGRLVRAEVELHSGSTSGNYLRLIAHQFFGWVQYNLSWYHRRVPRKTLQPGKEQTPVSYR